MPDQTITGAAPIASAESFPIEGPGIIQTLLQGDTPIASGEEFPRPSGVSIDPMSVGASMFISY